MALWKRPIHIAHPTLDLPICFSPANTHLPPRRLRRRACRATATIEVGITTMYTAAPFATLPRPILKQSSPIPTHQLSKSPDRLHAVHFPPSPTLTRTYVVHSSLAYDRSPISVATNACALPERGCPGRTYTLEEERPHPSSPPKRRSHHNGIHLHPRAVHQNQTQTTPSRVDDDPQRTPTRTSLLLPPPLVPDLSSSSESEESDSFFAPIPSILDSSLIPAPSIPRPRARWDGMIYTKAAYSEQSYSSYDSVSPLLPNSTPPDDAHKARRRKLRDRSRSRERHRETRYTSDEGSSDGGYTPFSHCAGYSFNAPDDGCLGGF